MKQLNKYRVCGTVSVDVYMEIDAPSLEEAIEYAESNFEMVEYCNGSVGVEDSSYEFGEGEVTCCDCIEWHEEYSELVEEDVEDENFIWNSEEEDEDEIEEDEED